MPEQIGLEAILEMSKFNKGMGQYLGGIDKMEKKTGGLGTKLTGLGKNILGVGAKAAMVAGAGIAAMGAGLTAVGVTSVKTAAEFESQMAILSVAAGDADATLQDLKDTALAVGADTSLVGVSASQAADAMTGLYKAGLTTNDIFGDMQGYLAGTTELSGALRAAVDLQAASELDLAAASGVVAIAMSTFGLSAEDATRISDNFVQAADASVAEVGDLTAALKNVGPVAAQFGFSLEDTNNTLAILSTRGIKGSEAGTALRSMMTNLLRPTKNVKETLEELGVELYNADGTMRSMPEIIEALSTGMAGLTEEQRNVAIQTLAGTYGMRAMNTLLDEGVAGWNAMEEATASAGTAQEVAAARTNTFEGAMEALDSVIETLKIQIGDAFLPVLTELVRKFGDFVAENGPAIAAMFAKIAEWIGVNLPIAVQYLAELWAGVLYPALVQVAAFINENVIPVLKMLWEWLGENLPKAIAFINEHWEAFRAALIAIGAVLAALAIAATIAAIAAALAALVNPITLVIAAIGLLAAAWAEDWGGIRTFLTDFWKNTLEPFVKDLIQWFQNDLPLAIQTLVDAWNTISEAVTGAFDTARTAVESFVNDVIGWFQGLFDTLVGHSIITDLVDNIIGLFGGLPKKILGALADLSLGTIIKALEKGLTGAVGKVSKLFLDEIGKWQEQTQLWIDQLVLITEETLPDLQAMFETVSLYILEQLAEIIRVTDEWRMAIEYIINTTLPALQTAFVQVATAIIKALGDMITAVNKFRKALEKVINNTLPAFKRAGVDAFKAVADEVWALVEAIVGEGGLTSAITDAQNAIDTFVTEAVADLENLINKIQEAIEWFKRAIVRKQQLESGGPDEMNELAASIANVAIAAGLLSENLRGANLAMPIVSVPAMAGASSSNVNNFDLHFGPTTINNGMDQAVFEGRVRQTVRDAIRGV
jgi:TP901 family phage tail tape measure protein